MKDIEQKAVEILDKLEALATQYTPDVLDAAVAIVQVNGIRNVVCGFLGIAAIFLVRAVARRSREYCQAQYDAFHEENPHADNGWEVGVAVSIIFGVIATLILAISSVVTLCDVWNWVAMFDPKLALAQRILGL